MNDQQLERLLRMSAEVDDLERPVVPAPMAVVRRGPTWRRLALFVTPVAAAAGLVLAVVVMTRPTAPTHVRVAERAPERPAPEAAVEAPVVERVASVSDEESVIFAILRGPDGECTCLRVKEHEWGSGRTLGDIGRAELLRVAFRDPCSSIPQPAVIVAVSGPRGSIPNSRKDAEALAARMSGAPLAGRDISSLAYAALPNLPAGTTVVAESVSFRP